MILISENKKKLKGNCILKFGEVVVKSTFTLYYFPKVINIEIPFSLSALTCYGYGEFIGNLKFSKKIIRCSKIAFSSVIDKKVIFLILDDLYINGNVPNTIYEANLIGVYSGNTEFNFENLKVSIQECKNRIRIRRFCNDYGNVLEGNILKIRSLVNESVNIDRYKELTNEICVLYSLMSGKIITFNRCETYSVSKLIPSKINKTSLWRIKSYSNGSKSQCVSIHEFGNTLEILLPNFHSLSFEDKKCYYTVIDYLNCSARYLEEEVLNIAQAWEIMADHFSHKNIELSDEIKLLKTKLKTTIKEWKKENNIESTDFISNRVINSLSWDTVIKKIENLIIAENLDRVKLKVDFKKLIEIRNSIVHTGRFKVVGEEDNTMSIINSSVLALQVLILSKLGYTGEIIFQENLIWNSKEISFFKS
ncbi:hypothetical protein [Flavobacterium sp.]|uniref:hypothetical protein n=1 Tax=Flavobacterium sp. TaxID=239 RepID=UPI003A8DFA6C